MGAGMVVLIVAGGVLVWLAVAYNRLVRLKNRFVNAFSQIDVQLQRRHELVPNLVAVARAFLDHEHETLVAVTDARNGAERQREQAMHDPSDAVGVAALARAESSLSGTLGQFKLLVESYPALQANETLADLHDELASTENRVGFARQAYSDAVMRYNTVREQFPDLLAARLCRFEPADPFEVHDETMRDAVHVSFA